MKRITTFLTGLALVLPSQIAFVQPVAAQQQQDVLAFCHTILPIDPTANLGECVAFMTTMARTEDGWAAQYCDTIREAHADIFWANWVSHSDCVRSVRKDGFIIP